MKRKTLAVLTMAFALSTGVTAFAGGAWQQSADGRWWFSKDCGGVTAQTETWRRDDAGNWYSGASRDNLDNSYVSNGWWWIYDAAAGNMKCYYFDGSGYMLANTTTPDGYQVNEKGEWVKDGAVVAINPPAPYAVMKANFDHNQYLPGNYEANAEARKQQEGWQKDTTGWWYRMADGQFCANGWWWIFDSSIQGLKCYYFDANGKQDFVVAETPEEALALAREKVPGLTAADLVQESDCLDTWFSSWLWPISVFDGINHPDNEDIKYYYPTNDLVTGPDIIFFWVARMIMAGYEYKGKMPFKHVYFTGIVRDKLGRKMSKSLGNSPDPLMLIDKYGADGVRMGMMLSAPAGNDILFDEALCEQGRNFNNKIWNAFRLVKGWQVSDEMTQPAVNKIAVNWFNAKLKEVNAEMELQFKGYRISEALMTVYRLFWDEFSSWYLEMVKPAYGTPIDRATYEATLGFFDTLLKMLHPFMPFITEELWQHLYEREYGASIMRECLALEGLSDGESDLLADIEHVKQVIGGVRTIRNQKNISPKEALTLQAVGEHHLADYDCVVKKMANLSQIEVVKEKSAEASAFMVSTDEYAVPLGNLIDVKAEIEKAQAQLAHLEGFLAGVRKKLANEKFVAHAPENVVALERKKESDSLEKIAVLKQTIAELSKN